MEHSAVRVLCRTDLVLRQKPRWLGMSQTIGRWSCVSVGPTLLQLVTEGVRVTGPTILPQQQVKLPRQLLLLWEAEERLWTQMVTVGVAGKGLVAVECWDWSCRWRPHWEGQWGTESLMRDSDRWLDQGNHSPYCETPSSPGNCRYHNRTFKRLWITSEAINTV